MTGLLVLGASTGAGRKSQLGTMATPAIGTMVMKMVLIVAVLAAIAWYLRRRSTGDGVAMSRVGPRTSRPMRASWPDARPQLKVLSRQALGKGACIAVVEWDGQRVLVGVTPAGISFYNDGTGPVPRPGAGSYEGRGEGEGAQTSASASEMTGVEGVTATDLWGSDPSGKGSLRQAQDGVLGRPTFLEALRDLSVRR